MLAKTHGNKSKAVRKAKKTPASKGMPTLSEKYDKADALVEKVYCDIANGVSRSVCLQKLQMGEYGNMPYKARQSAYYYNMALDRFAVDTDIEAEKLRQMFYGRYESLLEDAVAKGDIYNARGILDSMARIFGVERKTPDTAIMINSDKEGGVTVNFGFAKTDED
jgi:hypothetical protein